MKTYKNKTTDALVRATKCENSDLYLEGEYLKDINGALHSPPASLSVTADTPFYIIDTESGREWLTADEFEADYEEVS